MQNVLVTGATSGIGRAMAVSLGRAGYAVRALGRSAAALESLKVEVPGIETLALDLEDRDRIAACLVGFRVDVLVNNAGMIPPPGPFDGMDLADIGRTVAVNLQSVLWVTRMVVPQMRARGSGHVVFTGSQAAHSPGANFALYAATKAAISAFATGLRADVGACGIRVTELVPGRVETGLYSDVLSEEAREAMYEGNLSLQPEDVAQTLLSVLALPARASVSRVDIVPTRPVPPIRPT